MVQHCVDCKQYNMAGLEHKLLIIPTYVNIIQYTLYVYMHVCMYACIVCILCMNKHRNKCWHLYTVTHHISIGSELLNPLECIQVHSAREVRLLILNKMRSKYRDVTTCFYAYSDIPKSLEIFYGNF